MSGTVLVPIRAVLPTSGPEVPRSAAPLHCAWALPGEACGWEGSTQAVPSDPQHSLLSCLGLAAWFLPAAISKLPPLCL